MKTLLKSEQSEKYYQVRRVRRFRENLLRLDEASSLGVSRIAFPFHEFQIDTSGPGNDVYSSLMEDVVVRAVDIKLHYFIPKLFQIGLGNESVFQTVCCSSR